MNTEGRVLVVYPTKKRKDCFLSSQLWNVTDPTLPQPAIVKNNYPLEIADVQSMAPFTLPVFSGRPVEVQYAQARIMQLIDPDKYRVEFDKNYIMWEKSDYDNKKYFEFTFNIGEVYTYDETLYAQGKIAMQDSIADKIPHIFIYHMTQNYLWDTIEVSQMIEYITQ